MTTPEPTITSERPPEVPRLHPLRWMHENLFSSVSSGILTAVFGLVVVGFLAGVLGFIFGENRQWDSVSTNSRFYGTLAYPAGDPEAAGLLERLGQYLRVWISLGIAVSLTGLSLVAWGARPRIPVAKVTKGVTSAGWLAALVALLAPWSTGFRAGVIITGVALALAAFAVRRTLGTAADEPRLSLLGVIWFLLLLGIVAMWLLPEVVDAIEIASTTKVPLTAQMLLGTAAYWAGLGLIRFLPRKRLQQTLVGLWLLSLPVVYLVILRDPVFDYDLIRSQDVPIAVAFLVGGSLLLWWTSSPQRHGFTGLIGGIVLVLALAVWFPPLNGVIPWIKARLPLLVLAMFTLASSSFGGSRRARRGLVAAWVVTEVAVAYFLAVGQAGLGLTLQTHYLGGLALTLVLAFAGLLLAFPLGILLALGRTSTMPIFRLLSTGYIEAVRGVPLITILFFGSLFLPLFLPIDVRVDVVLRAVIAISLFSAAYLAENVRGGLQSIPRGQYEAARAVGLSTVQLTALITLPQALRAVIPALVGQIIALFKDTSLVIIIGLSEILTVAARLVPGQPAFIGSQRENLLFVAMVYWVFTFTFSRASQRLERKLGIGER